MQEKINEDFSVRPRRYIIKRIAFTGGEIRLGPRGDAIKIPMEDFVLEDLGVEEGGLTSDELVTKLIREIALRAMRAAEDAMTGGWGLLAPVVKVFRKIAEMLL